MASVIGRSEKDLRAERQDLIALAGIPLDELRRRAEAYQLTAEQMDILDAIKAVDYLLGED